VNAIGIERCLIETCADLTARFAFVAAVGEAAAKCEFLDVGEFFIEAGLEGAFGVSELELADAGHID